MTSDMRVYICVPGCTGTDASSQLEIPTSDTRRHPDDFELQFADDVLAPLSDSSGQDSQVFAGDLRSHCLTLYFKSAIRA